MVFLVGPEWFYGIDYIFDLVSVIVGMLISYFSYRTYRYTSQKKYFYFSASFFLVALAFVGKILTTIPAYSSILKVDKVSVVTVTRHMIGKVGWINQFGVSLSRLVMLLAFLLLVLVSLKIKDKKLIALFVYFLIISTTFVSQHYIVFHVTLLLLLMTLYVNYRKNYLRVKSSTAWIVMNSFLLLLISQLFFIFAGLVDYFYVIGEGVQLFGYLILLVAIAKVFFKK